MAMSPTAAFVLFSLLSVIPGLYVLWLFVVIFTLPFGLNFYFICDEKIWSFYQRVVLFFFETWYSEKVIFHGDYEQFKKKFENVLYIANHQTDVDWIVCDTVAARQGRIGRLRYVLKEVLKYVPIFGHYFYQHGCIYVDRGNFSENKAVKGLKFIDSYKIPCWLVIFPEGTRVDPKQVAYLQKSADYARKLGLEPLRHHLFPRVRGTELIMQNLGDYLEAVYDITVFYEDCVQSDTFERRKAPDMFSWFHKKRRTHIHIQRIPISDVPRGGDELRNWLHSRFIIKDQIFDELIESMKSIKSDKNAIPHLSETPFKEWKICWNETLPFFLLMVFWNIFFFYFLLHSWLAYFAVWILGTISGLIVVKYRV